MLQHRYRTTGTLSSGAATANTPSFVDSVLYQVYVKMGTATTEFDFSLTDVDSDVIAQWVDVTGTLNRQVQLPVKGILTWAISNGSVDDTYTVKIIPMEKL